MRKPQLLWGAIAFVAITGGTSGRAFASDPDLVIRVDGDAGTPAPVGNGASWGTGSFKYLQDAIAYANTQAALDNSLNIDIWVASTSASNPYRPDRSAATPSASDPNAEFRLEGMTRLLGGFLGSGSARDAVNAPSVLSGELDGTDRSRRIVGTASPARSFIEDQLLIDGFVITGAAGDANGAGMQIQDADGSVYVARTRFVDNSGARGGGLEVRGEGGGFDPIIYPEARIVSCEFVGNAVGTSGGGLINTNAESVVYSTLFAENSSISVSPNGSRGNGGAITNASASMFAQPPNLEIVNSTFVGNIAESGTPGSAEVGKGGGIFGKAGTVTITNSIFWQNRHNCPASVCDDSDPDPIARQQIYILDATQFTGIEFSIVEDAVAGDGSLPFGAGVGMLDVDPVFEAPAIGNYRVVASSPGIDAGDSGATTDPMFVDQFDFDGDLDFTEPMPELDGRNRKLDLEVDLGAYERLVGPCPGDVDGNAQVDFQDLLELLVNFGPCPVGPCPWDFGGDGQVDFQDLLTILGNWGPCNADIGSPPSSVGDCIQRVGTSHPEKLAACIEAMILTSTP